MNEESSLLDGPTSLVTVSRSRLTNAYDSWRKSNGRAARQSEKTPERHSDRRFIEEVKRLLDLSRDDMPHKIGLPGTRAGWANWRSGRSAPMMKLRLDVCRAVRTLTGVDATANQFLTDTPINSTDLVTISDVTASTTSEKEDEVEVTVGAIAFRASDSKDLLLSDTRKTPTVYDGTKSIGTVRFSLKQASIFVSGSDKLRVSLRHLSDGPQTAHGCAMGAELSIDDEDRLRWRVQPPFPKEALQARLENLRICEGALNPQVDEIVGVSVESADIIPVVTLSSSITLSDKEHQETKARLIEKLLKNRNLDDKPRKRFVLSEARISEK